MKSNNNTTGYVYIEEMCDKCGNYIVPPLIWYGVVPPVLCNCQYEGNLGWICPKCNKGQNPLNDNCDCN